VTRVLTNATSGSKAAWVDTSATDGMRLIEQRRYADRGREEHSERATYFLAHGSTDALAAHSIAGLMACSRCGSEWMHWFTAFVAVQSRIGAADE
jgi:hypothetical protein